MAATVANFNQQQQQLQALQRLAVLQQAAAAQQQQPAALQKPGQRSNVAMQRAMNNANRAAQANLSPAAAPGDGLIHGRHHHHSKHRDSSDDEEESDGDEYDNVPQQQQMFVPPPAAAMGGEDGSDSDEEEDDEGDDVVEFQAGAASPFAAAAAATAVAAPAATAASAPSPTPEAVVEEPRAAEATGHHDPAYPHHTIHLLGALKLPRNGAEAVHFYNEGIALEGDKSFDCLHMKLSNNLLVASNNSDAALVSQLKSGSFYVTNARFDRIQNHTEQIFEVSLTTGHSGEHCHCTLLQGETKHGVTIYSAPFEASTKRIIDEMGIINVEEITSHIAHQGASFVILNRVGDAERAANVVTVIHQNLVDEGIIENPKLTTTEDSLSLPRKEFEAVLDAFKNWKKGVSLPVQHNHLGVKVHRRSIYENPDQTPAERWISDLDKSHTNCLSFVLELTIVSGMADSM